MGIVYFSDAVSKFLALSLWVLFIFLMQSVNGAEFLKTIFFLLLLFLTAVIAASFAPYPTTVITAFTSMYASL